MEGGSDMKKPTKKGLRNLLALTLDTVGDALISTADTSNRVKVSDLMNAELNMKPAGAKR